MVQPFPMLSRLPRPSTRNQEVVFADFSQGLLDGESPLSLRNNEATVCKNMLRNKDGSITLRQGVRMLQAAEDRIVRIVEFNEAALVFLRNGKVFVQRNFVDPLEEIWSDAIAATRPGSPLGWTGTVTRIDTTVFNGQLVVVNGKDKPLIVSQDFVVNYLQDPASGTNIFTPIARFVTTVGNFCIMAGVTGSFELYISSAGSAGVWPGDEEPNNSTTFNIGALVAADTSEITGLASFHDNLVVFFKSAIIVVQIGEFEGDLHKPKVVDAFTKVGAFDSTAIAEYETRIVFLHPRGLFKLERDIFTTRFEVKPLSDRIGRVLLRATINACPRCQNSFLVAQPDAARLFIFIRQVTTDQWASFEVTHNDQMSKLSWGELTNLPFATAASFGNRRLLFSRQGRIFVLGTTLTTNEEVTTDIAVSGSGLSEEYSAVPIPFDYETGWLDAEARMRTKKLVNLMIDSFGRGEFTLQMFVDMRYKNNETGELMPVLQKTFRGGDTAGFGIDEIDYGGGRNTANQLWSMPSRFRLLKVRIFGTTDKPLTISSIAMTFRVGGLHR